MIWFMDSELCDCCGEELDLSPVATICQRCYEAMVDRVFAEDSDLYDYIMYDHDMALATAIGVTPGEIGELSDINPHGHESQEEAYRRRFGL